MINKTITRYSQSVAYAVISSLVIVTMLFMGFFLAEPTIGHGQIDTAIFSIRQTITDETSFLVDPSDITMAGDLNGVTGGNATGTTQFVVQSNNATGYYVEIDFEDNAGAYAMLGDVTSDESLRDYSEATSTPTFGFTASTAAQFAYTITSTTSADTGDLFLNNGSQCGLGSTQTAETCWMTPSTTAIRIVDRITSASTGATSTITFKMHVPNGAVPIPSAETYTATATLSLFTQ